MVDNDVSNIKILAANGKDRIEEEKIRRIKLNVWIQTEERIYCISVDKITASGNFNLYIVNWERNLLKMGRNQLKWERKLVVSIERRNND